MSNLFELNKYENQVDTLITVCFILSAMSTLATAIAWIGLAACTVLLVLSLLVQAKRRILVCPLVDSLFALLVCIYLLDRS